MRKARRCRNKTKIRPRQLAHFTATTRIKRSAFNMTAYELLVADEIEIQIDAPLRKK